MDSILRAINLEDELSSSAFRGGGGGVGVAAGEWRSHKPRDEDNSTQINNLRVKHPSKGAKFVASPNYYSQKRVKGGGHEINSTAPIF